MQPSSCFPALVCMCVWVHHKYSNHNVHVLASKNKHITVYFESQKCCYFYNHVPICINVLKQVGWKYKPNTCIAAEGPIGFKHALLLQMHMHLRCTWCLKISLLLQLYAPVLHTQVGLVDIHCKNKSVVLTTKLLP